MLFLSLLITQVIGWIFDAITKYASFYLQGPCAPFLVCLWLGSLTMKHV